MQTPTDPPEGGTWGRVTPHAVPRHSLEPTVAPALPPTKMPDPFPPISSLPRPFPACIFTEKKIIPTSAHCRPASGRVCSFQPIEVSQPQSPVPPDVPVPPDCRLAGMKLVQSSAHKAAG